MNKFFYFLILSFILIVSSGCSKITEQARLDRFNEKLNVKEQEIERKLNKNIQIREKNITNIKQDIKFLKSKIKNSKNNKNVKIKESFQRYAKNIKSQGEVQLIHYEIEMLEKLAKKELKLNEIKNQIAKISTSQEQVVIKNLKNKKSKLKNAMDDLYIDISWFESANRINLINAQKSAELINDSNIYAQNGNFITAIDNVNKAKKLTPNIPIIHAQLGSLYYLTGKNKLSLSSYKKAKELNSKIEGIEDMITFLENKISNP
tara:strand:- start:711 stop:1496 length:786 start_codon:yes stop_codon:yes gene_type:complete